VTERAREALLEHRRARCEFVCRLEVLQKCNMVVNQYRTSPTEITFFDRSLTSD
jgi:hypothetical protein